MPFFPALPPYRPAMFHPAEALMSGIAAGQEMVAKPVRTNLQREALQQSRMQREASQKYAQSGDVKDILPALPPAQAALMKGQAEAQQLELGLKAADYFDSAKFNMTWETYPKFREGAISKFGSLAEQQLPPPEAIGSGESFEKWKTAKMKAIAEFKALPQTIAAQSRIEAAKIRANAPKTYRPFAPVLVDTPQGPQWADPNTRQIPTGATGKTGKTPTTSVSHTRQQQYLDMLRDPNSGVKNWFDFLEKEKEAQARGSGTGKEATLYGKAATREKEAKAEKTEGDVAIKKHFTEKITGGAAKPKTYTNSKTGEVISAEEYERRKAAAEGR